MIDHHKWEPPVLLDCTRINPSKSNSEPHCAEREYLSLGGLGTSYSCVTLDGPSNRLILLTEETPLWRPPRGTRVYGTPKVTVVTVLLLKS